MTERSRVTHIGGRWRANALGGVVDFMKQMDGALAHETAFKVRGPLHVYGDSLYFLADANAKTTFNGQLFRIDLRTNRMEVVIGLDTIGEAFAGDGLAAREFGALAFPQAFTITDRGELFVLDAHNARIRRLILPD